MRLLTEKKQKKIVEDILKQAEETQVLLMTLSENGILSPKEFGNAISWLAGRTTNLANEIYGMKGVIMCNEKFGIGGR